MRINNRPVDARDLLSLAVPSDPQISPDAAQTAFTLKTVIADENRYRTAICIVSTMTPGDAVEIAEGASPRWSPDGSELAFVGADGDSSSQVFCLSMPGGNARCLTEFPPGHIRFLSWSPDGRRLAFSFRPHEPAFTSAAVAARQRQRRSTPPRVLTTLAYREEGRGYVDPSAKYQLYLLDAASGQIQQLTTEPRDHGVFCFSSDSAMIAYAANISPTPDIHPKAEALFLLPLGDNTYAAPTRISECPVGPKAALRFSPAGSELAFSGHCNEREGLFDVDDVQLFVCNLSGGTRCVTASCDLHFANALTNDIVGEGDTGPHWSADGRALFMLASEQGAVTCTKSTSKTILPLVPGVYSATPKTACWD